MESMAELMSNSLLLGSFRRDTSHEHLLWVRVKGDSLKWSGERVSFLEGLEADHQWREGRVRLQIIAEKGDKFNVQETVLASATRKRQESGEKE